MKTIQQTFRIAFGIAVSFALASGALAQNSGESKKPSIAIVDFDTRGYEFNQTQAIQFITNELIRVDKFEVMDRYEVEFISKKENLVSTGCFSKVCLSEFGQKLGIDKMFTGSMMLIGDRINITLRMLDVKTAVFEKTLVKEFLNIPGNELMMIRVTINEMYGLPSDEDMVKKLTVKAEYDNTVNNPYSLVLKADGPRMGVVAFSGITKDVLMEKTANGGYAGAYPFMFQFGYQFEKQYLNEGNFQALIEFIPTITGLDQGKFIPSFTFLNGLRNNRNGWEFAFGPTFNFVKMADGFMHNDQWYLDSELEKVQKDNPGKTFEMIKRPDNRGDVAINTGFVFAVGKTFKSGKMNIPLNLFVVPGNYGWRFGLSFGWNGKERYELND